MKTVCSIALGLLLALNSSAQTFTKTKQGAATDITIDSNGDVYVVGVSKQIFKYNFSEERFKSYFPAYKEGKTVSASGNTIYITTTRGLVIKKDGRYISRLNPDSKLFQDVYIGKTNDLWGIDNNGKVFEYKRGFRPFPVAGNDNKKVAVNNSGRVFTLKNNNTIYEYYNGRARKLPGAATDIAYDHVQKKLYVLGISKRFFVWNPRRNNWDLVKNTRNDFKSLAAHNGKLWGTTTRNEIYASVPISNTSKTKSNDTYKLKITLDYVKPSDTWDNDGKDDYTLHFLPTLKLDGKEQKMKYKKYTRIKNQIESYGPLNALHIRRTKGQQDFASVQLHLHKGYRMAIGNSGIFEIPKNYRITNSRTDFNLNIVVDEVSSKTERIMNKNEKLDLKSILDFLTGKLYPGNRRDFVDVIRASSSGLTATQIQMRDNKRYVYESEYGEKRRNGKRTGLEVHYVIELVD